MESTGRTIGATSAQIPVGNMFNVFAGHSPNLDRTGVALTAGTILAGIIGAILSVPLAAVGWAAIKAWNREPDEQITDQEIEQAEWATQRDEDGRSISATRPGPTPSIASGRLR